MIGARDIFVTYAQSNIFVVYKDSRRQSRPNICFDNKFKNKNVGFSKGPLIFLYRYRAIPSEYFHENAAVLNLIEGISIHCESSKRSTITYIIIFCN